MVKQGYSMKNKINSKITMKITDNENARKNRLEYLLQCFIS